MTLKVTITQAPAGPVSAGTRVTLTAVPEPETPAPSYTWALPNGASATGSSHEFEATPELAAEYTVTATVADAGGLTTASATTSVQLVAVPDSAESPITFRPIFAILAALVIAVLFGAALKSTFGAVGDFKWSDGSSQSANRAVDVGGVVGLVLLIIGGTALAVGLWMAVVEFAGRFRSDGTAPDAAARGGFTEDAPKIIEAIGKLKGVALVLVVACIPLLAAAYVARGGVEQAPPTTTTTTSATSRTSTTPTT